MPVLPAPSINHAYSAAPRGLKRSRSPPDVYGDATAGQADDGEFSVQDAIIRCREEYTSRSPSEVHLGGECSN